MVIVVKVGRDDVGISGGSKSVVMVVVIVMKIGGDELIISGGSKSVVMVVVTVVVRWQFMK